jgi:hypothetical protein
MTFPAWRSALFRLRITVEMPPAIGCCRAYGAPRATITARGNDHVDVAAAAAGTNKARFPLEQRRLGTVALGLLVGMRGSPVRAVRHQSARHTRARAELPRVALGCACRRIYLGAGFSTYRTSRSPAAPIPPPTHIVTTT